MKVIKTAIFKLPKECRSIDNFKKILQGTQSELIEVLKLCKIAVPAINYNYLSEAQFQIKQETRDAYIMYKDDIWSAITKEKIKNLDLNNEKDYFSSLIIKSHLTWDEGQKREDTEKIIKEYRK